MSDEIKEAYEHGDYDVTELEEDGSGWALFAGVMMWGISLFAATALCVGIFNSALIEEYSALHTEINWLFFGIFDAIVALVAFIAGIAIWRGLKFGFWLGIIFSTINAARWFLFSEGAPVWSLIMIGVWVLVIYGLIRERKLYT